MRSILLWPLVLVAVLVWLIVVPLLEPVWARTGAARAAAREAGTAADPGVGTREPELQSDYVAR